MNNKKKHMKIKLPFILCILLYIAIQIVINLGNQMGTAEYNGVFMAFQFAICTIMLRDDHKKGFFVSIGLLSISMVFLLMAIFGKGQTAPIPGFVNSLVYLSTLALLAYGFHVRDREAVTDIVTGLYNRRGLYSLIENEGYLKDRFHLVYLDIENYKMINDDHGHAYGELLLKNVANLLKTVVGNDGKIARMGSEEFVLLLNGNIEPKKYTENIINLLSERISLEIEGISADCYLTLYAGISTYPSDSLDYTEILKYADMASYEAAQNENKKICFFNKKMELQLKRNMEVERVIKESIEKDYFYLVYQPQYKMEGKKLRGFETLLRLKTPDGTSYSPAEFIPIAEKGDIALKIDDYVLNRAMREFKELITEENKDIIISVNVSARNISRMDFVGKVSKILEDTEFNPRNLEIEITEYCLAESVDITISNIKKLHDMGVQVALDDFGTGYTSLSYLAKMPINLLKIDKSMVDDIETDKKSRDFIDAVVSIAHIMGCEVISEGVETVDQLELLRKQKCDFVQGYVWGKPLDYSIARGMLGK